MRAHKFVDGIRTDIFNLLKCNVKEDPLPTTRAYGDDQVSINQLKIQDVKRIPKYIPNEYKEFYNTVCSWKTTQAQEEDIMDE